MPRTSKVESPSCPPLRVLTTDVLGLVKVVEVRGKVGIPKVVETWGPPDASRGVVAASLDDSKTDPLLAIARKNGLVELLNPLNGDALATLKVSESNSEVHNADDDPIVALHLFRTERLVLSSRSTTLLTCTENRRACLRSIAISDTSSNPICANSPSSWDVCAAGKVLCSSVDGHDKYALFAGKGIEINVWDLDKCNKIWTAKSPPCNSLGIFAPTWFTSATFLCKEDHRKIAAGTNNHQVRLYDISTQRRPVISFEFRETPIKAITGDINGYTIYLGTGSGDLASFDMRTGKLLGCFVGKCCGSIRSIARHPELPVLASCGLDSYLRLWDTKTRQLLSSVFLKQHLTNVTIDSSFSDEEAADNPADTPNDLQVINQMEGEDNEISPQLLESSKSSKEKEGGIKVMKKKKKKKKVQDDNLASGNMINPTEIENNEELPNLKRRNHKEEKEQNRSKHKKIKKTSSDDVDES